MTTTTNSLATGYSLLEAWRSVQNAFATTSRRIEARRRERADNRALAEMSDRDLHDIGLDRGFVNEVTRGRWVRDAPDV